MPADAITHTRLPSGDVAVYLVPRRAGTIIPRPHGYAYVPAGQPRHRHGEVMRSVAEVLQSLVGEDG